MALMLAHRARVDDIDELAGRGYLFDLKIDGCRCLAEVTDGTARLSSRSGADMTRRYPEVIAALEAAVPTGRVVLDGEIAVNDERGLPSWPLTHKRDAQQSKVTRWSQSHPATYYAFDILELGSVDMRKWAYANRRQVLEQEVSGWGSPTIRPVLQSADGHALWDVIVEHQLEGMVAKRADSQYRPGRSRDWLKIKRTSTVTCLVGGYDPGEGGRANSFGCLHLYLLDEAHNLVPVGKVGSGFSDRELRHVAAALPHPPVIVEVEFLDVSPDRQLRQPVFQRLRTDAEVTDCTLDQLGA